MTLPCRKFAVFILTHGRPDNCLTYETLKKCGYTGKVFLILDNLDKTESKYREKYGDEVIVFDKDAVAKVVDRGDNAPGLGTAMFARNACWDIARGLGLTHFVQLDDDYTNFQYRFDNEMRYSPKVCRNLNRVFNIILDFVDESGADSVAMAQGGDYIGGEDATMSQQPELKRKCMNSWFCVTARQFPFTMRMNDDVTAYVVNGIKGKLFFTLNQVNLNQIPTQAAAGGMTELYRDAGTYVKTFYTIMASPSSVKAGILRGKSGAKRVHHMVNWDSTVPKIIRESVKIKTKLKKKVKEAALG